VKFSVVYRLSVGALSNASRLNADYRQLTAFAFSILHPLSAGASINVQGLKADC
jgi:hypothetical protein